MNLLRFEDASASILPGRYRHFKGKEYEVLYVARHSETEEPMVVYRALYGDCGIWVRPAYMWNETVERDGKVFRRFEKIPDLPDRNGKGENHDENRSYCCADAQQHQSSV